jgi:hypothetical protein
VLKEIKSARCEHWEEKEAEILRDSDAQTPDKDQFKEHLRGSSTHLLRLLATEPLLVLRQFIAVVSVELRIFIQLAGSLGDDGRQLVRTAPKRIMLAELYNRAV